MSAQWYVLHVYSGFEKSVAESIQKLSGYTLLDLMGQLPTYLE